MAVSTIDPNGLNIGQIGGRRNLIINGAMQVAQRGTQTNHASGYTLDRWNVYTSGAARFTVSKDTDVPSGQGFGSSLKIDVTTADTDPGTSDFGVFRTILEGQDLQSIRKGTSNAEKLTISFWVKSTVTGTYILEFYDAANGRQVSKSYTVDVANTWEKKTITYPADTTGTFNNDNTANLYIQFGLAMGSNFTSGTLNTTWASSNNTDRYVGQVNAFNSTSNNIYITGVQLELGDVATPFEHRSYGEELSACQRYYYSNINNGNGRVQFDTYVTTGIFPIINLTHPTTMRANPTVTKIGTWTGSNIDQSSLSFSANITNINLQANSSGSGRGYLYADTNSGFSCDAEL